MSKYERHQSVISRYSDSEIDEDNWINKLEKSLQKDAVQSRNTDQSIFDQISSIMNNKSKHSSVEDAVNDMKNRSGLTAYLDKINKISNNYNTKKVASDVNHVINKKVNLKPIVISKCPKIEETISNYIESTRGNLPIPAIIDKIRSIHQGDVSEASDWEDDNLIRYVSHLNLKAKSNNYNIDDNNYRNLGKKDHHDDEIDPSNVDAFYSLSPAKF